MDPLSVPVLLKATNRVEMDSHVKVRNGHVLNLSGKLVIGWLTSINAIHLLVQLHKCSVSINSPSRKSKFI